MCPFCLFIKRVRTEKMIILASASPRRKEILSELGVDFRVVVADTDESSDISDPVELTRELARRKGLAVYEKLLQSGEYDAESAIIISADTVVCRDGEILGKPRDRADAVAMLTSLSGRSHTVVSGVAVTVRGVTRTDASVTTVRVQEIPREEIERYVDSGEPMDKAGAYGIQGRFSAFVEGIDGCYFGVVGLPVNTLSNLYLEATGERLS